MNMSSEIMCFDQYLGDYIDICKPYLNKNMFNYWTSLTDDSSVILYNNGNNNFIIPDIIPRGVYIKDYTDYCGNEDMIIVDVVEFKKILLMNGFSAYFDIIEDVIYSYDTYLSNFEPECDNYIDMLKNEVYDIL